MVWDAISCRGLEPFLILKGEDHRPTLSRFFVDHFCPIFQILFPGEHHVLQHENAPVHTAHRFQTWFDKHNDEVKHLRWSPQSSDLNIILPFGFLPEK